MNHNNVNANSPPNSRILHYEAVLLYDVLGQSSRLREIKNLPVTASELSSVTALLQETAGTVMRLRDDMRQYYDNVVQPTSSLESLPPEHRKLFEDTRKVKLTIRNFSDLTIANVPLIERTGSNIPMTSVFALIGAAASMVLVSLARGTPIRGAIDVGLAINLEGDEIYGPILDRVYRDESEIADWPRIVVGPNLIDYLDTVVQGEENDILSVISAGLARTCQKLISYDNDGRAIVDYLGPGMKKYLGATLPVEVVENALNFAEREQHKFDECGNSKLSDRYAQVVEFCHQRMTYWT
jgi:hypothetical protein